MIMLFFNEFPAVLDTFTLDFFQDKDTWKLFYQFGDPIIIASVVFITMQIGKPMSKSARERWLPLVVLALGTLAAFAVQVTSPYDMKLFVLWRRMLTYAGGASLAWSLRKLWVPRAMFDNGLNDNGGRE